MTEKLFHCNQIQAYYNIFSLHAFSVFSCNFLHLCLNSQGGFSRQIRKGLQLRLIRPRKCACKSYSKSFTGKSPNARWTNRIENKGAEWRL